MGKTGWKYVLCYMLIVVFLTAMILYIRELKTELSTKGATLVLETEEGMVPG